MLALLAQLANSFCFLFKGEEKPSGAFQTGGTIGDIVGCSVMLLVGGRALWTFHDTGGLHYDHPERDLKKPLIGDDVDGVGEDDDGADEET